MLKINMLWSAPILQVLKCPHGVEVTAWYDRERPHYSLGLRTPRAALNDAGPPKSRICWRDTKT